MNGVFIQFCRNLIEILLRGAQYIMKSNSMKLIPILIFLESSETKQSLFVKGQSQEQPEAQREFEFKELEGTFIRGHIQ